MDPLAIKSMVNDLCRDVPTGNTEAVGSGPKKPKDHACYRWMGTWAYDVPSVPTYVSPEDLWRILKEIAKEFYFQLERGATGYEHYQFCFSLIVKHRLGEVKDLLGSNTVHLERVKNWAATVKYCTKEDTRIDGWWSHEKQPLEIITTLREWQQDVVDHLKGKPDKRSIIWFCDPIGNAGKTQLCKYLYVKLGATIIAGCNCTKDIAYLVAEGAKIICFNFARQMEGKVSYQAIECLKDGLITSSKYKSCTKAFNSPHVLVFSNWEPDVSSMSLDKWVIVHLSDAPKPKTIHTGQFLKGL